MKDPASLGVYLSPSFERGWKNAEAASEFMKRLANPNRRLSGRGRLKWLGEMSEEYAQLLHRGIGGGM